MPKRSRGKLCCSGRDPDTDHNFTVTYDSGNHFQVLCQCWGSVWKSVLPYCIFNVALAVLLWYLKDVRGIHFKVTDKGHTFLTMVVSFLIVSRATMTLQKYNRVQAALSEVFCRTRQLIDNATIFSSENINQSGKYWRHQVAYLTMLQLRSIMAVINYSTDEIPGWDLPEMDPKIAAKFKSQLFVDEHTQQRFSLHRLVSENEENMRVPVGLALAIRFVIVDHRRKLEKPFSVQEELALLNSVDAVMSGYYNIRMFLTTPIPFPLAQMSRTFLFFYLFTIPFALLADKSNPVAHFVVVFFLTFGFVGMEQVSIELDDPFGNDANDFDNSRMCATAMEDTYTNILDMDGEEWTDKLRKRLDSGIRDDDLPLEADMWLHYAVEV